MTQISCLLGSSEENGCDLGDSLPSPFHLSFFPLIFKMEFTLPFLLIIKVMGTHYNTSFRQDRHTKESRNHLRV